MTKRQDQLCSSMLYFENPLRMIRLLCYWLDHGIKQTVRCSCDTVIGRDPNFLVLGQLHCSRSVAYGQLGHRCTFPSASVDWLMPQLVWQTWYGAKNWQPTCNYHRMATMIGVVTHSQLATHHFRSFHGRILHPVGGQVHQRFLRS